MSTESVSKVTAKQQARVISQPKPIETITPQPKAPQDISKDGCNQQAPGSQETAETDRTNPKFKTFRTTPDRKATLHLQTKVEVEREENEGGPPVKETNPA